MILRDSILDATTTKVVIENLIRRSKTFEKTREDILMELGFIVEDIEKSIDRMDRKMMEAM
jgi:hypothetical protein